MNKDKFVSIDNYGELEIDRVIFDAGYPILFTCTNKKNEEFICVCCQNDSDVRKWLLSRISYERIIDMLKDEITIREAFLNDNNGCKVTINLYDGKLDILYDDRESWSEDSIYLPSVGEYIEAEPGEFDEDIRYYQNKQLANIYIPLDTSEDCSIVDTYEFNILNRNVVDIVAREVLKKIVKVTFEKIVNRVYVSYNMPDDSKEMLYSNIFIDEIENETEYKIDFFADAA